MYQSFPQKSYCEKSSAMPVMPPGSTYHNEAIPCEPEKKGVLNIFNNNPSGKKGILNIFDSMVIDDIIIIGLVILLLTEGNDDWLIIGLLVFLLMQ